MAKQTYYKPVLLYEGGLTKLWKFKPIENWIWKQWLEYNNEIARKGNRWRIPDKKPKFPIKEFKFNNEVGLYMELIDGCEVTVEFDPIEIGIE